MTGGETHKVVEPVASLWRHQPVRGGSAGRIRRRPAFPIRSGRSFRSSAHSGARTRRANSPASPTATRRARALQCARRTHRPGDLPSRLPCADAALDAGRAALLVLRPRRGRGGAPAPGARGAALHDGADRVRASLPDDDDQRLARAAEACAGAARRLGAADPLAQLRSQFPPAPRRSAASRIGMGMTEKQGGTDVRANLTRAESGGDGLYASPATNGSSPRRCPTLSWCWRRRQGGLTCSSCRASFRTARVNAIRLERLKDKLGNRSNASAEVEFHGAAAWRVGNEGQGHRDHPRNGDADAARLRRGERRADARRLCRGGASRPPSRGLRQEADRPAADAAGARRHGARPRRRAGAVAAAGRGVRHGRGSAGGGRLCRG